MTELLFRGALGPQPGGAVELVFGGTASPPVDPPGPVIRPGLIRTSASLPWRAAAPVAPQVTAAPWRAAAGLRTAAALPWQSAAGLRASTATAWGVAAALRQTMLLPWAASQAAASAVQLPWRGTTALASVHALPWRSGAALASVHALAWRTARPAPLHIRAPWAQAMPTRVLATASARSAQRSAAVVRAPWRAGVHVLSIGGPWEPAATTPPLPAPCYLPDPGNDVLLLLREAGATGGALLQLLFACRRAALAVVPIRRVYMVTNVTSLVRVSDDTSIPCLGFSLSLDVDSWAWGFSASVDPSVLALVEPDVDGTPVELAAWVNGTEFRVFTEAIGRERTFGQVSLRVQGRGKTAVLGEPISLATTFSASGALTSQQLLDQALPSGWTADFQLDPWLVPGGVWSHQGTPISAAVAIAQAGGGYVQPHASASSISVLPLYPVAPWAWGSVSPDIELPAAYATREGIEWVELPRYNRVYVSGTTAGVLGRVTRTGTAGDVLAPMVTDALITTTSAARQRGLPVLAKTGRLAYVTLRLPVSEGTGVIRPGKFVRYVDGSTTRLGLVRSVAVDVAGHQVWQNIRLETFA